MKKKGISHIEMILSFTLFIAAVGFGLYFFNTGDSSRLVDTTLTYAIREIEGNTSTSIEVFSVGVNSSAIPNGPLALNFSGIGGNASVETYDGNILGSSRGGDGNELVYVSSNWANENVLFVSFGEEFQDGSVPTGAEHNETYYKIGSSEVRVLLSEKKFKALGGRYRADYKELKNQDNFNLPSRADFGFSLVFDNGINISAENEIPDNFEVFSKTKRVEVLKEDGSRAFADLVVKVW
ncbi:hypothetical protein J4233_02245 [Candidatus Pacearchaeota archaeon]|nr:hypothetical protein [Candidatus Pacearchaeota archaeon]